MTKHVGMATTPAGPGQRGLLTPTQLSAHLACAHYTQLERKRRAGELHVDFMPDPRLEAMRERGAQHERAYVERLRQAALSFIDLREKKDPQATLAAMREGAYVISMTRTLWLVEDSRGKLCGVLSPFELM